MEAITLKHGARSATIPLQDVQTVGLLLAAARTQLGLAADAHLRVLNRGKALPGEADALLHEQGVKGGAKLMVLATGAQSLTDMATAKPERMRGFDEDDERTRTGGVSSAGGSGVSVNRTANSSQAAYGFRALEALPVGPSATPPKAAALQRLQELASDKAVLAVMKEHQWSVGALKEMPPEGLVGVSASCLMGLNRNHGEEILLRLRTDDWRGLRPYGAVIEVLMHELAHNVHSDHDANFKALNSMLRAEYAQHASRLSSGRTTGDGAARAPQVHSSASAGAAAPTALGGHAPAPGLDPRAAAALAAISRATATVADAADGTAEASPAAGGGGGMECVVCEVECEEEREVVVPAEGAELVAMDTSADPTVEA